MSGHVYNGSAWERVKTMHVHNGTIWEQIDKAYWWNGSAFEQLYARPISIFDDFNRANTTGVIGPLWTKVGTNSQITSNTYATSGTSDGSRGIVTVGQINTDDGYVEVVMAGGNNTADTSLRCRCNSGATSGLSLNMFGNKMYLSKFAHASGLTAGYNGEGMTDIASNTSVGVASGDTIRLEFEGNDFVVKKNGTPVSGMSVTNSTVPQGPGQRYGAIRVERAPISQNSAAINSFKLADIGA